MVKQIIRNGVKNGSNLLFRNQQTIFSGAVVIAAMLLLSAVLGLVKKRLYASIITSNALLDTFFLASRPTDIIFQLLVAGAINAAFIPIFSELSRKRDRDEAWKFVSQVLNITSLLFFTVSVLLFIFARPLAFVIAPGFTDTQMEELVPLIRIFLLSPIFLGISSFIAGTLQSFRHFFLPFLAPVVYNLGGIFGIVVLYPGFGIQGAAWGVVIGSVAHLLIQLPLLRYVGFQYYPTFDFSSPLMKKMFRLALPRSIGAGIEQIKTLVLLSFGSLLPIGSITFMELGQSVANITINLFGVSFAQASLPQLAELAAEKKMKSFYETFQSTFNQILFFIMPANVILIVLKIPVVRLVYGSSTFTWEQTVMTAWVVALLGVSIFAQALNNLLIRFYYALHETKLPVILGGVGMLISVVVGIYLVKFHPDLGASSLAIAMSVGAIIEFILLLASVFRKYIKNWRGFLETPIKILISSVIMGVVMYIPVQVLDQQFIDTSRVVNLLILVWLVVSFGFTTYFVMVWVLGVNELRVVFTILAKVRDLRSNIQQAVFSPHIISSSLYEDVDEQNL